MTRMSDLDFVYGVIHWAALSRGGKLWFNAMDERVHAGMKAAFDELRARADTENLNLRFVIQPERGSGLSGIVESRLSGLLYTPLTEGNNGSYINLVYDATNPVSQSFYENDRRVGTPQLFADLAEIFLETAERPPELLISYKICVIIQSKVL